MRNNLRNMIIRRLTNLFIICYLLNALPVIANTAYTGMRDITSTELVKKMGAGWNLGNTLDAEGPNETYWGNPYTTKEMIDEISKRGFKTFRIPVTWRFHMGDAPDYTVEKKWLDRVEEVANYGFANNMYVIINIHHDDPWIIPTYAKQEEIKDKLGKLWKQIANRFKDYSDYLIFETINEPRYEGSPEEWTGGTAEGRDCVNKYHKACLDAIRATGGNNTTRFVMISPYAASASDHTIDAMIIPNNDSKTIISIHNYFPWEFCLKPNGDSTWGSTYDKSKMTREFDRMHNKLVGSGRGVILGEICQTNRNNLSHRLAHAGFYSLKCAEKEFCPIYWDIGDPKGSGILDRRKLTWFYPEIADTIISALNNSSPVKNSLNKPICSNQLSCFPDPKGSGIQITYILEKASEVNIGIVNSAGIHVKTILAAQHKRAGSYNLNWNRSSDNGHAIPSGIYFIVLTANSKREIQKTVLTK